MISGIKEIIFSSRLAQMTSQWDEDSASNLLVNSVEENRKRYG